jgi:guanine deaminase
LICDPRIVVLVCLKNLFEQVTNYILFKCKNRKICFYIRKTLMSNDYHQQFMKEAIRLSIENVISGIGGPFGAVVVKNGKIIASGTNRVTSDNDPTAHAEVVAIRNACKELGSFQLEDCEIYTSCEPCPMCLAAIYWARPSKVYFGNTKEDAAAINFDDHFIYEQIDLPLDKRNIPMKQLMKEEAIRAFQIWKEKKDRIEY